jgi:hypothetical protein
MAGRTIYLGDNPNDFHWPIPRGRGHQFEKLIERYLRLHVATRDGSISVYPTRAVGDQGRDFEIKFARTVSLFGFTIAAPPTATSGTVFVECKSTEHDTLDDEFLVDASQHKNEQAAAYVLVTNAVVTPYCQWRAQDQWSRRGAKFCLVDRRKLIDLIYRFKLTAEASRLGIPLPDPQQLPPFDAKALIVTCQTDHQTYATSQTLSVYIALANYGESSVLADLHLATDLLWALREGQYERYVMPGMIETFELVADRKELDGTAELGIQLAVNGRSARLSVARAKFELALEPKFVGESHDRIRLELSRKIQESAAFLMVSLAGDAGVGKTRTIAEALEPVRHGKYMPFKYEFTRHGLPDLKAFEREIGDIPDDERHTDSLRLTALLRLAAESGVPIILHFEDLHHAEEEIITIFKRIILDPPVCRAPLVVILAGRDDHTFPNEAYYSLLQLVRDESRAHVLSYTLEPLNDADARKLIKSVVLNMPEPGVDRIHALGQNNPFIIIEALQYLLDVRLAQLLSRRTIGILNPEVFAGRQGLPLSVEDLYDKRLASLREADQGELAANFLIVASFFGFVIEDDVRTSFFDGENGYKQAWELLRTRRFVFADADGHTATFAHENLLHYFRRWSRCADHAHFASSLLLDRPGLCKRLDTLDLGEVYFLHGEYSAALNCFDEPCKRVAKVTNFSSEEIPRRYFSYLPALFHAAKAQNKPVEVLAKITLAYGYMGVHNFPLVVAEEACAKALAMLGEIFPKEAEGRHEKLAVAQLRAHALQNMGHTSRALQAMLEIEAELHDCEPWPDVAFDLHDRFSEYYRKMNHACLMDSYDRYAKRCVKATRDKKLRAAHLITHASARLFGGRTEAMKRARAAHKAAKNCKIERFITYTRLTELIVETIYSHQDASVLLEVAREARRMLRDAVFESFADSIMRLELLLGTISLYTESSSIEAYARARAYIESGQANSVRYGNGLFDWAFENLAAVIDIGDPTRSDGDVSERFTSCLERLRLRGLTFLGDSSGTYPNAFAVSNILRFLAGSSEKRAVEFLQGNFTAYDNRFVTDHRLARDMVSRAVKGQVIFWPQRPSVSMLRFPSGTGYFTPIF